MKTLGSFINKKALSKRTLIDEKSVFYVFNLIIKAEYGNQGEKNIIPAFLKDKKIFIKASGAIWPNEILLNKRMILEKINREFGDEEIVDLIMDQ